MSDVERRIEALEKVNRRWRYAAGLLASVLLIALVGAMKPAVEAPDLLQAKRIEVLAPDGTPRIVLSANSQASTLNLIGRGQDHERAISLVAGKHEVALMLMKHAEAPLFMARVNDTGSDLWLSDGREPSQEPRSIHLRSTGTEDKQGGTGLTLIRGMKKSGIAASLVVGDPSRQVALFLGGPKGRQTALRVNQDSGSVEFTGDSGRPLWSTP
jgi:hypothetical protein